MSDGDGEEMDHVARPILPWREDRVTECGLAELPERRIITRSELQVKLKRHGKTRTAMTTCITCWQTATRWKTWAEAPSDVMRREMPAWGTRPTLARLDAELRAIAALIAEHQGEFDDYLAGLSKTADLAVQRAIRRRRIIGDRRWTI